MLFTRDDQSWQPGAGEQVMPTVSNLLQPGESPCTHTGWAVEARERCESRYHTDTNTTGEEGMCGMGAVHRKILEDKDSPRLDRGRGAYMRTKQMARGGGLMVLWSEYLCPPPQFIC